jgi:hypothetical protein
MIIGNSRATDAEWDSMVGSVESTLYFQTREWFEIWSEYAGFKMDTRLITFASGKKVLLPLCHQDFLRGLLRVYLLAPKGMGGFVSSDVVDQAEKAELFGLLHRKRLLHCVAQPYDTLTNEFGSFNGLDHTQVLDLRPGMDSIFSSWSRGHHSRTNKGFREGIEVGAALTEDDWRAYFAFYQDTLERWGETATNRYNWHLFQIMFRRHSDKIKLWMAWHDREPVSGAVCFYHNRHVAYWHSATSQKVFKHLNATHVLQYTIIKDACQRGFQLYDFMPSSGIEGVIDFKSGFSPETRPVHTYTSPLLRLANVLRSRSRNMPLYRTFMKDTGF